MVGLILLGALGAVFTTGLGISVVGVIKERISTGKRHEKEVTNG